MQVSQQGWMVRIQRDCQPLRTEGGTIPPNLEQKNPLYLCVTLFMFYILDATTHSSVSTNLASYLSICIELTLSLLQACKEKGEESEKRLEIIGKTSLQ